MSDQSEKPGSRKDHEEAEIVRYLARRTEEARRDQARADQPNAETGRGGVPTRVIVPDTAAIEKALKARAEFEERIAKQRQAEQIAACMRDRNLPIRYQHADVDDVERLPPDAVEPWRNNASALLTLMSNPAMIALLGKRGTGKTHLAAAVINYFARNGRTARYTGAFDYLLAVRETWRHDSNRKQTQVVAEFARPQLLVIDEFHERRESPDEQLLLTKLIDTRYANDRSTIIISNLSAEAFVASAGDTVSNRFNDEGGTIEFVGHSVRGRLKARKENPMPSSDQGGA